jgi:catechol 2,3-dioxygenase-like lactoylglutathione lyase family enzyme
VIEGFSHVQLAVRDVPTSARWYCAVLGLEQFVSGAIASGPYAGLRHPTARFVIGLQTATPEQAGTTAISPLDHVAFGVRDRAALDEMRSALSAGGIDVGEVFEEAASYNVRLTDPDGLMVELTAPRR